MYGNPNKKLQSAKIKKRSVLPRVYLISTVISLAVFVCMARPVLANDCQSNTSSGVWSSASSWTNCGGLTPQITDTIRILAGHTITIDTTARTVAGVQVDNTGTLANGGFLLINTGMGTGVNGFTINGTLSGSGNTVLSGVGATIDGIGSVTATGTITMTGNKTIASTANITIAGTISLSTATTITNNGIVTATGPSGITGADSTSTWTQGTNATLYFAGNTTTLLSTGTLNATASGNTVNYSRNGNQTCKVVQYYHLSLSSGGIKTCAITATVLGNLSASGASSSLTWSLNSSFTVTGSLTIGSGASVSTGTSALTISGATNVSGSLTINGATNNKTFTGLITVAASGSVSGLSSLIVFGEGLENSGSVSISGTVTMNTTGGVLIAHSPISITTCVISAVSQVISGASTITFATLTINSPGSVTNNGTVATTGSFSGTGSWTQGVGSTFNAGGGSGNAMNISTFDASTNVNTVNYNGLTQTCKVVTYHHLTLSGSGTKTCAISTVNGNLVASGSATWTINTALAVAGTFTVSGATVTTGAVVFSVGLTTTVSSGTLSLMNNTGTKTFAGLITVSGGTLSGASSQITFQGGVTQTSSGTISITGTAAFTSNAQALNGTMSISLINITTIVLTNYGTLTVNGGLSGTGEFVNASTGTLNYSVAISPSIALLTATASGNTVNYTGTTQTCKVVTYHHLTLSGSGTKTCAVTSIGGNFTLSGTVSLTTSSTISVSGALAVEAGTLLTIVSSTSLSVTGASTIAGTLAQNNSNTNTYSGAFTVSSGGVFTNANNTSLVFQGGLTNNSGGTVNCGSSATVIFSGNDQQIGGSNAITIATATITGIVLTNTGTVSVGTALSGSGAFVQSTNARLNLTGSVGVATFTVSASGNTVAYDSTSSGQTVRLATYYHLNIEKDQQVATLGGAVAVLGNLFVTSGTLDVGAGLDYSLAIGGNYTNNGTFTARAGTVTFNGSTQQTLSGTLSGSSAFATLVFTNSSGSDDSGCDISFTPGIIFSAAATATTYTITTPSVRVQYLSGATYTFTNINWNGGAVGTKIFFRNSSLSSGTWILNVSGTQSDVSYLNVSRSDASGGNTIDASNGTNTNCENTTAWNFAPNLFVNIVDGAGSSVLSPSVVFSAIAMTITTQTSTATLGTAAEKIRITNNTVSPLWSLTLAASGGTTSVWSGSGGSYDFNDPTTSVLDGADADLVGGRLSVDPGAAVITPQFGCTTTGISTGSHVSFSEGVTDSITLISSSASTDVMCYWDMTGIQLVQTIPSEQPSGSDYALNMTLTLTAM